MAQPGTVAAGKTCAYSPNAPDLIATFFSLAGITPPGNLHGRDLRPLLKDPAAQWPHPVLYEHTGRNYGDDVAKVLKTNAKEAISQKVPWYTAVVQDRWKYIRYLQPGVPDELYDLGTDPEELKNLAGEARHTAQLARLRQALADELKRTAAPPGMMPTR
jgi:arylsulfatase A-like enzyme